MFEKSSSFYIFVFTTLGVVLIFSFLGDSMGFSIAVFSTFPFEIYVFTTFYEGCLGVSSISSLSTFSILVFITLPW